MRTSAHFGVRRSRWWLIRLAIAVLLVCSTMVVLGGGRAEASYWDSTTETRDATYRFFYDQSPQSIPSGYDPVAEAESYLARQQANLSPSNTEATSLWKRIRATATDAELMPKLRMFGTIGLAFTA